MTDEEDAPHLSAETFKVLQEFYNEQEEKEKKQIVSMQFHKESVVVEEDWQLSQFWYNDATTESLVNIALATIGSNGKVALISCPTLYKLMKQKIGTNGEVSLFEYDRRFSVPCGDDFYFYDYKSPLEVQKEKSDYYDLVIADPPFISEECFIKTAITIRYLTKKNVIVCTGAVMSNLAKRLLDLNITDFIPEHKNNLGNEFRCFSNFIIKLCDL